MQNQMSWDDGKRLVARNLLSGYEIYFFRNHLLFTDYVNDDDDDAIKKSNLDS